MKPIERSGAARLAGREDRGETRTEVPSEALTPGTAQGIAFNEREWRLAPHDTPPMAAHLVTVRRGYKHHGIYIGNGRVVHYAGLHQGWKFGPVEAISLARFSRGRPIWVRPHPSPRFEPCEIVERACSRLGEDHYRVLSNNCEHLCEWCFQDEHRSRQVEAIRFKPRRLLLALRSVWERWLRLTPASESGSSGWATTGPQGQ